MVAPDDELRAYQRPPSTKARRTSRPPVMSRAEELTRLRQMALNEGLPLVDRARAVVDRLWLIDDLLSEELNSLNQDAGGRPI
jgi:hypothetical protein